MISIRPLRLIASMATALMLLLSAIALTGCSGSSSENVAKSPVKVGTLATEDILPMWVAEDEGLFEKHGLEAEVVVFQSATELIAAISAGEVDFAMTDPMVAASLVASGTDLQIEWITLGKTAEQGRFGLMTSDPGIKTLSDLEGKSVGVGSNTILEYVMDCLLEDAGVDVSKVKVEELQKLPVRYESMATGQVDAAALPASLLALGEAAGFTVIADDTQGDNISQSVMVARVEYLASDSGIATQDELKKVWDEAVEMINGSPETFRSLLVEKASLSSDIADTYKISQYPKAELPTSEMIDPILDWMSKKGYLSVDMAYSESTGKFSIGK